MKTRGIKDLYLPSKIALHVKFLLFCAAFTPVWGLIIHAELSSIFLTGTFVLMFVQMEILHRLSNRIFAFKVSEGSSRGYITRVYLTRLLLFFISALLLCLLLFSLFIIILYVIKGWQFPGWQFVGRELKGAVKYSGIALSVTIPIFLYIPWQQSLKREFELREQNLIFQNETLKSQINPHFLFNSLNTLSSLVVTQTEVAELFISKLSLIYRYILENSSKTTVSLTEELEFIRDYFYLHGIRSEGKILLTIDIKDESRYRILPVSLQVLVENAIKHNMATWEKPLRIVICIEDGHIVVKNNVQKMATRVISTKVGLKNLAERVRLVTGKNILIEEKASEYRVKVPLLI